MSGKYEVAVLGDADCPEDAIRSLLHITLTRVADFQVKMLEVIGERFKISMDDMVEAIRDAPSFQAALMGEFAEKVQPLLMKTKSGKKVVVKKKAVAGAADGAAVAADAAKN